LINRIAASHATSRFMSHWRSATVQRQHRIEAHLCRTRDGSAICVPYRVANLSLERQREAL